MARNTLRDEYEKILTTLGEETFFSGVMSFSESLKIKGHFDGEIDSSGFLYIEEGADVAADINVRSAVIGGVLHGNIVASDYLELLETGKIFGNVKTSLLRIADGVTFEGKCEMIKDPNLQDVFSSDVEKLKQSVERL